jgi:hypothetical protein
VSTNEQQQITEIRDMLKEHITEFRVFRTALMGDDKQENQHGRLPILEAAIKEQGETLKEHEERLNRPKWMLAGISFAGGILITLSAFLYHLRNIFMEH